MSEPIKICTGSHGGKDNLCSTCKHNMEFHPDFNGSRYEPEGKYRYLSTDICRLPMGPDRRYWVQYESRSVND